MGASYKKLVRDKVPEHLDSKGVSYEQSFVQGEEFRTALIQKLREETEEFFADESVEELADVMEVIRALRRLTEYSDAKAIQRKKRNDRGGFDDGIIISGEKE